MEARRSGRVNRMESLEAALLPAYLVLAVAAMLDPRRPFGERLSLLLALGVLPGLASLWTAVVLGYGAVNRTSFHLTAACYCG